MEKDHTWKFTSIISVCSSDWSFLMATIWLVTRGNERTRIPICWHSQQCCAPVEHYLATHSIRCFPKDLRMNKAQSASMKSALSARTPHCKTRLMVLYSMWSDKKEAEEKLHSKRLYYQPEGMPLAGHCYYSTDQFYLIFLWCVQYIRLEGVSSQLLLQ